MLREFLSYPVALRSTPYPLASAPNMANHIKSPELVWLATYLHGSCRETYGYMNIGSLDREIVLSANSRKPNALGYHVTTRLAIETTVIGTLLT